MEKGTAVTEDCTSMTLGQVRDFLQCEVFVDPGNLDAVTVTGACGADLMSDVLAYIKPGALLLTGLTSAQSVRTAEVADIRAVVYVRNKHPEPRALALAHEIGLPLLGTPLLMYEACGRLHAAGLPGCATQTRTHERTNARAHDAQGV